MKKFRSVLIVLYLCISLEFILSLDVCMDQLCDCLTDTANCQNKNISQIKETLIIPEYITNIDCSNNEISNLEDFKIEIKSNDFQEFDLSSNVLEEILSTSFQYLNNSIKGLNLRNNIIHSLDKEAFISLRNLVHLHLSYNKITSLPDGVFDSLSHLEHLDLSFNPIKMLKETTFMNLQALQDLNLSFLHLEQILPEIFDWNLTVAELDLSYNYLTSVPSKAIWYLRKTLKNMSFSGNLLETLPAGSFFGLSQLRVLTLEQLLYLRRIEAYAFKDLSNLETFVLRYLPVIRSINPKAFRLHENETSAALCPVRDFSIDFTTLTNMHEDLLVWKSLRYASLRNNRWICDCKMKWIKSSSLQNITQKAIYCSEPLKFRGRNTASLKESDFSCSFVDIQSKNGAVAFFGIVIFGTLISFTTVIILVYRRNGWVCRPPRVSYDKIDSPLNTITIFDRSSEVLSESGPRQREMVYIHDP